MELFTGAEQEMECLKLPVSIAFKRINKNKHEEFAHKAICWWTKSELYHVEIVIGDIWISSTGKGTHVEALKEDLSDWNVLDIEDVVLTREQYNNVLDWLKDHEHMKYDWLAIVMSQFIPIGIQSDKRWFCSEMATRVLQLLGYPQVQDVEAYNVSPGYLGMLFNYK